MSRVEVYYVIKLRRWSYLWRCSRTQRRIALPSSTNRLAIEATWALRRPAVAGGWSSLERASSSSPSLVVCADVAAGRDRSAPGGGDDEPRSSLSSSGATPTGADRPHTSGVAGADVCSYRQQQPSHVSLLLIWSAKLFMFHYSVTTWLCDTTLLQNYYPPYRA